jgi:phosphopantothenoylcysteine decarboxylase/phosphopantothenate--cysteine ligase
MNKPKVLITAGPTLERIDDVRFISNFSSGKMGFAIAEVFNNYGYAVTLVSGPVNLDCSGSINRIDVESAQDMYVVVADIFKSQDIIIMSAAVADFTPKTPHLGKIKKTEHKTTLNIELKPTIDILAYVGQHKSDMQILVGFALESENEIEYGKEKLTRKNCDMIVINSANKSNSGFGGDDNTITILTKTGQLYTFPTMSKLKCAEIILEKVEEILIQNNG